MRIAVCSAVHNEERHIGELLRSLSGQTRLPDEVIFVDDGSADRTVEIINEFKTFLPHLKCLNQHKQGPAVARNRAWHNSTADICIFTDGDCVPEPRWIEKLLSAFVDEQVAGACGGYKTLNTKNILARFIGLEIKWKYRNVSGPVDAHGAYNLAVRRCILDELGGFKEDYPEPSGEDWDLTYRISKRYQLIFVRDAVVGHYHPEKLASYLFNQARRAYDRIKVYRQHPDKRECDIYTPRFVKYQIAAAGLLLVSLVVSVFFNSGFDIAISIFIFVLFTCLIPFPYLIAQDLGAALYSIPIQFLRSFAWCVGAVLGVMRFGISLSNKKTSPTDWNRFWHLHEKSKFKKISWSKIRIMAILDQLVTPGMRVLDAGSGSGFFSKYFLEKHCHVYSLDYSEAALEATRQTTQNQCADYLTANLLDPKFAHQFRKKFDLIFTDGLLEHFTKDEQKRILEHISLMKSKNGIIATFVPNRFSPWQLIRPLIMPGISEKPFTLNQLKQLHEHLHITQEGGLNVIPFRQSPDTQLGRIFGMIVYCIAK